MSTLFPMPDTGYWLELKRAWLAEPWLAIDQVELRYTLYYRWSNGAIEITEAGPIVPGQVIKIPRGAQVRTNLMLAKSWQTISALSQSERV